MPRRLIPAAIALFTAVALQLAFAALDPSPTARWTFYAVTLVVLIVLGTVYSRREEASNSGPGPESDSRRGRRP